MNKKTNRLLSVGDKVFIISVQKYGVVASQMIETGREKGGKKIFGYLIELEESGSQIRFHSHDLVFM